MVHRVRKALEVIQAEINDGTNVERFLSLDRELHPLTYSGCRIEPLNAMVERFWNTTQPYRRAYTTAIGTDRRWIINAEHRLLIAINRSTPKAQRPSSGVISGAPASN
jgi:DNA-binding GntR family transcriptional regulator